VTPRLVDANLTIGLQYVELSGRVLVLPRFDLNPNGEEYYVVENRRNDAGPNRYDDGILDSGIAIWQAITDPAQAAKHPIGVTQTYWDTTAASATAADTGNGTMGRWGIRLIRAFTALTMSGVAVFPDGPDPGTNPDIEDTLWDNTKYAITSGPCPAVFLGEQFAAQNKLAWADCTASGYGVKVNSAPAQTMNVQITAP
jgi:hypothetical protein